MISVLKNSVATLLSSSPRTNNDTFIHPRCFARTCAPSTPPTSYLAKNPFNLFTTKADADDATVAADNAINNDNDAINDDDNNAPDDTGIIANSDNGPGIIANSAATANLVNKSLPLDAHDEHPAFPGITVSTASGNHLHSKAMGNLPLHQNTNKKLALPSHRINVQESLL